jgi:predicted regulator of Ras-like GTPase activity (Roadblock/LC7/MglB family)
MTISDGKASMLLDPDQRELAARCLWLLQESDPMISGAILSQSNGLSLVSTFAERPKNERMAAVSTALLRLCEWVSNSWGRGQAETVWLQFKNTETPLIVQLLAVDYDGVLLLAYRGQPASDTERRTTLVVDYLTAIIQGAELPSLNGLL